MCNLLHKFLVTKVNILNLSHDDNEMSAAREIFPTIEHTSGESGENLKYYGMRFDHGSWNFDFYMITHSQLIADDHRR